MRKTRLRDCGSRHLGSDGNSLSLAWNTSTTRCNARRSRAAEVKSVGVRARFFSEAFWVIPAPRSRAGTLRSLTEEAKLKVYQLPLHWGARDGRVHRTGSRLADVVVWEGGLTIPALAIRADIGSEELRRRARRERDGRVSARRNWVLGQTGPI
jgi:hypothetical protein